MSAPDLLHRFEEGSLAPADFTHLDHLRVAYELLARHEFLEATARFSAGVRRLAQCAGAPEKFNATITLAFLALISERMALGTWESAEHFVQDHGELTDPRMLSRWYSPSRLASAQARQGFLLPDRCPQVTT